MEHLSNNQRNYEKNAEAILFQLLLSQKSDTTALRQQKFLSKHFFISGSVSTMQ